MVFVKGKNEKQPYSISGEQEHVGATEILKFKRFNSVTAEQNNFKGQYKRYPFPRKDMLNGIKWSAVMS